MRQMRLRFFFLVVAVTLSGCGILGGSDSTDVTVAEDVAAQPTVNNVQSVPAQSADSTADAALPTAVTLPTTPPMPEPTVDRSQPTTYIVQSGDVLGLIAERFDADIAELRRINNLDGNLIRVGQELTIPALEGSTEDTETAGAGSAANTTSSSAPVDCNSDDTGHCVQPGESLLGIALKYDVTVDSIRAANPEVIGDLIKSGEVLNLPGSDNPAPPATDTAVAGDADCKAKNQDFPFYHAADGLCYANPPSDTPVPTAVTCEAGRFLWTDGLCYPIPGYVSPTDDYGTVPCRAGYLPLESGRCWPAPGTTPSTVTPGYNVVACTQPNFVSFGTSCDLLQAGIDAGCILDVTVPKCPSTLDS